LFCPSETVQVLLRMKFIIVVTLCALAAIAFADEATYAEDSPVKSLTPDNFDEWIKENNGFVEFFAPWCGHCKSLKPIFEGAAKNLDVKFAAVDADKYSELGQRFEVQGFPTIFFFKGGEKVDYEGERTEEAFGEFAEQMSAPPFKSLANEEELKDFVGANDVAVVGTFADLESDAAKAFVEAADGLFTNFKLARQTGEKDGITAYLKDEDNVEFDGEYAKQAIKDFVATQAVPSLEELSQKVFQKRVMTATTGNFILFVDPKADNTEALAALRKVAKARKGEGNFFWIDGVEYADFAKNVDLTAESLPGLVVLDMTKQNHFVNEGALDETNINAFVTSFTAGELKRDLKSEDIPTEAYEKDVLTLVSKNFDEKALSADKDVLVMFYAPWCGHCKKLKPIWSKVAKYLKSVESVEIAKINMDDNELASEHAVQGFPTLRFYPSGEDAKAIEFEGGRTFKDIVKFVKKNAAKSFDLPAKEAAADAAAASGKDEL